MLIEKALPEEVVFFDYEDWYKSRDLEARDYQLDILNEKLPLMIGTEKRPAVLAAAPGAGKTMMSIAFADQYLATDWGHRVLVLAHAQILLRSQFAEALEVCQPGFSWQEITSAKELAKCDAQMVVMLPQTLNQLKGKLPHFDLVIVDEAHQYYFQPMVQEILKKVKPFHQLLLTGTPSPFIARKYPVIDVTVAELLECEAVTDVLVENVSSTYDFVGKDYTASDDLRLGTRFRSAHTRATLEELLLALTNRLQAVFRTNSKTRAQIKSLTTWDLALRWLGKSMFVCQSQKQAIQVRDIFLEQGINVVLSISDLSKGNEEVAYFKKEKDCLVFIVVGRGVLGFDYPELVNVVDMTCSRNPDRVFQLLCRAIRPHPKGKKKVFLKVIPHTMKEEFRWFTSAVLHLIHREWFLTYDGTRTGFYNLKMLCKRENRTDRPRLGAQKEGVEKTKQKPRLEPIDFGSLQTASDILKDLPHGDHGVASSYAYTTLRDAHVQLSLIQESWTREKCLEVALLCKTRTEFQTKYVSAYRAALENGWLPECCAHMEEIEKPKGYWHIKANCLKAARTCKTRTEFQTKYPGAYNATRKNGWLPECCAHMEEIEKPKGYWHIKANCLKAARTCKTRTEFFTKYQGAYNAARKNGWFPECCAHMGARKNGH